MATNRKRISLNDVVFKKVDHKVRNENEHKVTRESNSGVPAILAALNEQEVGMSFDFPYGYSALNAARKRILDKMQADGEDPSTFTIAFERIDRENTRAVKLSLADYIEATKDEEQRAA